jgi:hypothetical protein
MQTTTNLIEIYRNPSGCVYQCDKDGKLVVEFGGTTEKLSLPCFWCLKKSVDKINLEEMANNIEADIELVTACGCERCYILSLTEAYLFKDLLAGTKVMMELNSIIYQKLYTFSLAH